MLRVSLPRRDGAGFDFRQVHRDSVIASTGSDSSNRHTADCWSFSGRCGRTHGVLNGALAAQGIEECKALVAASRMSYYELSEIGAYSTQRRRRWLHSVRNVTSRNRSAPAKNSAVSASRNTIYGWRSMECTIVQTAARPATSE